MQNKIFLTGDKGIGKSTAIRRAIGWFRENSDLANRVTSGTDDFCMADQFDLANANDENLYFANCGLKIGGLVTQKMLVKMVNGEYKAGVFALDLNAGVKRAYYLFEPKGGTSELPVLPDDCEVVMPGEYGGLHMADPLDSAAREENAESVFNTKCAGILESALSCDLIVIDELGPGEEKAADFLKTVEKVLDSDKKVIGVLQSCDSEYISAIKERGDVIILEVTKENRDTIWKEAARSITEC